jgi:hypothetical protein
LEIPPWLKESGWIQVWWHICVITALGRLKQEDGRFEASPSYIRVPGQSRLQNETLNQKRKRGREGEREKERNKRERRKGRKEERKAGGRKGGRKGFSGTRNA